jgi:hypothetical protein
MRIQEHLFHGFFGIHKKEDAAKYYSTRIDKLRGIDSSLDNAIEKFQIILGNHNTKLDAYIEFLKDFDKISFEKLKSEIMKLEGMFDIDEEANVDAERYILGIQETLKDLLKNEENNELTQLEREAMADLRELSKLLDSISPLWVAQIDFIKHNEGTIFDNKTNIKILSDILKEEGDILRMEEKLLKKIDLKTGTILRKTQLKMKDVQRTKDMNMTYREIKHIR